MSDSFVPNNNDNNDNNDNKEIKEKTEEVINDPGEVENKEHQHQDGDEKPLPEKVKALLIVPGKPVQFVDYYHHDRQKNDFFKVNREHLGLSALMYKGFLTAAFFSEDMSNMPINILASALCSYLRDQLVVKPIILRGDVLIVDDYIDLDIEKLKMIQEVIITKKQRNIPVDLHDHITQINKELEEMEDCSFKRFMLAAEDDPKRYGLKVGKFPSWL